MSRLIEYFGNIGNYFDEAEIVEVCSKCGKEIYSGDECLIDENTGNCYCSDKCALQDMEMKEPDYESGFMDVCPVCGSLLTDEFEAVEIDGTLFCDSICAMEYVGIKGVAV